MSRKLQLSRGLDGKVRLRLPKRSKSTKPQAADSGRRSPSSKKGERTKRVKPTKPQLLEAKDKIADLYTQNKMSITRIARLLGFTYSEVRWVLKEQNIHVRGSDYSRSSNPPPSTRLTVAQYQSLVNDLKGGQRHAFLSRKYGISRERVRQIASDERTPTGRELQQRDAAERKQKYESQKAIRLSLRRMRSAAPREQLSEMWKSGMAMKEIAAQLGTTPAVIGATIGRYRKRWPSQFPYRYSHAQHNPLRPNEVVEALLQKRPTIEDMATGE